MTKYIILEEEKKIAILYSSYSLEEVINIQSNYNTDDIYLGKITNILKSINVAFIKLEEWRKNGFLVLEDNFLSNPNNNNNNVGDEIIVQIIKEEISDKGPTVSENINIRDREIKIYLYGENTIHIDKNYKHRNKQSLLIFGRLIKPRELGLSIRETKKRINLWDLTWRIHSLTEKSLTVKKRIKDRIYSPCLISCRQEIIDTILKKILIQKETVIIVESKDQAFHIKKKLRSTSNKKNRVFVEYWLKKELNNYKNNVNYLVRKILNSNTTLSTGGHIIIEKTEALTSIDVNSGSFNKLRSSRETILWINLAATKEIISQLKLKNISGIIVVDFIGMINQVDQLLLLEYLDTQLQLNLTESKIIQISEIGLVEITKKREGKNIYDVFTRKCSKCRGLGYVKKQMLPNKISTNFLEMNSIYG